MKPNPVKTIDIAPNLVPLPTTPNDGSANGNGKSGHNGLFVPVNGDHAWWALIDETSARPKYPLRNEDPASDRADEKVAAAEEATARKRERTETDMLEERNLLDLRERISRAESKAKDEHSFSFMSPDFRREEHQNIQGPLGVNRTAIQESLISRYIQAGLDPKKGEHRDVSPNTLAAIWKMVSLDDPGFAEEMAKKRLEQKKPSSSPNVKPAAADTATAIETAKATLDQAERNYIVNTRQRRMSGLSGLLRGGRVSRLFARIPAIREQTTQLQQQGLEAKTAYDRALKEYVDLTNHTPTDRLTAYTDAMLRFEQGVLNDGDQQLMSQTDASGNKTQTPREKVSAWITQKWMRANKVSKVAMLALPSLVTGTISGGTLGSTINRYQTATPEGRQFALDASKINIEQYRQMAADPSYAGYVSDLYENLTQRYESDNAYRLQVARNIGSLIRRRSA